MNRKLIKLILIIISTGFYSCTYDPTTKLSRADWLIGTWQNKTGQGVIYENWTKKSDKVFIGKSYLIAGRDTMVIENMQLIQKGDSIIYIPTVTNQNQNRPVRFSGRVVSENLLIFSNAKHDFPQTISYSMISKDSLVAEISGRVNGNFKRQIFPMKRIKAEAIP